MITAVQFGAGNIGRGFMGQLFWEAGFKTIFVEADPRLVELLNARRRYTLRLLDAHKRQALELTIDRFEALSTTQGEEVAGAIAEARLVCTAVGVKNLELVAPLIAAGIRERCRRAGSPVDVWLCENLLSAAPMLERQVAAHLDDRSLAWSRSNVGFVGTAVARMVPSPVGRDREDDPLLVVSDAHHELPYDACAVRATVPEIDGLQGSTDFEVEMARKLFTHNLGHACLAYLGRIAGYTYVHQGFDDPWVSAVFDGALDETTLALMRKYPRYILPEEHARIRGDVRVRFANPLLLDTVARVAKDPIRKLGAGERLMGSAQLCLSQGVLPSRVATVCGAALRYEDAEDPDARRLQGIIAERGIEDAITQVCGLARGSVLSRLIADRYRELSEGPGRGA